MDEIYVCDPRENALISQNALGERLELELPRLSGVLFT